MKSNCVINKLTLFYEYNSNFFNYDELTKDKWTDLLINAKEKFKIFFDLENNESCKIQREIIIPQNMWKFTKCKFRCELCHSFGDWQEPVYYFKIQLSSGYCFNDDKENFGRTSLTNSFFIFIPGKEEGNYHLVPSKKEGEWTAPDLNNYKKGIDPEPSEKDCWKSLELYLKKLVNMEIKKLKKENNK